MSVPVTVITGALGVGKTTSILNLVRERAGGERWAVLVNEMGEVGIDGPVLSESGLFVKEIAGGCVCCTAGVELQVALVRLLREIRPARLLVEPTGLAHPAAVLDALRRPGLRETTQLNATITLVDPRHLADPRRTSSPTWQDQVAVADVLVANKADLCSHDELRAFFAFAAGRWPPPAVVARAEHGRLDPAWLDLRPGPEVESTFRPLHQPEVAATGWGYVWPAEVRFDRARLREVVQSLVAGDPALPLGLLRFKGIFLTEQGASWVQADEDSVRFVPSSWRSDSRVEILAPPAPLDEAALRARLTLAIRPIPAD